MKDEKKNTHETELNDEELDRFSGGGSRGTGRKAACKRCGAEPSAASLLGGYCSNCLDELHRQGVYPPI